MPPPDCGLTLGLRPISVALVFIKYDQSMREGRMHIKRYHDRTRGPVGALQIRLQG